MFNFKSKTKQPPSAECGKCGSGCRCARGFFLLRWLRKSCTVIGALMLTTAVIGGIGAARKDILPEQMVLYINLDGSFTEVDKGGFSLKKHNGTTLRDAVDAIETASHDNRVKGIVAQMGGGMSDMGQLEELHDAILKFRESKKFSVVYAEDFSTGLGAYYLASAFDKIWLQPVGMLALPGIRAEMPYGRDLMDKVGVTPDFFARGKYKSLFESFELNKMSPASQEAMSVLISDMGNVLLNGIAQGRHKTMADINAALDKGVLTDQEAKSMGFVDELGYRDALMEGIRQKLVGDKDDDKKLPFYKLSSYAGAVRDEQERAAKFEDAPHVALIYAVGEISSGSNDDKSEMRTAYGTGSKIAGDDLSADIREAARDKDVKFIVMRVNSPGGSPAASETIRRAVQYAQGRGKKVYVSMGSAAASGGYWISSSADRIYALPMTLTGSIGVAGGKFVLEDLWKKLGITWDGVSIGKNAGLQSMNYPYNETQRAGMNKMFDHIYQAFITRVSEGRHMPLEQADKVAQGRVWSGTQGKALGLVDKMGGLDVVLNDVAVELKQKDRFALNVEVWPKPESTIEKLSNLMQGQVGMVTDLQAQAGVLHLLQPVLDHINTAARPGPEAYEPIKVH